MAVVAVNFAFFTTEMSVDIVRQFVCYIKNFLIACNVEIADCRFDEMTGAVKWL